MAILNIQISQAGIDGLIPKFVYIQTNDSLATVTTVGYLNQAVQQGYQFLPTDLAFVSLNNAPTALLAVVYSNGNWSLESSSSPGDVVLPTTANNLAWFNNATGQLTSAAGNVSQLGNLSLGASGVAGELIAYPSTTAKGNFIFKAQANTGNTTTTFQNASMGQATVITVPDPGASTATSLLYTGTAIGSGNVAIGSSTAGLLGDSSISSGNLQLKSQVKAATVTGLGGSGAGPLTVTVAGLTSSSVVVPSVVTASNSSYIKSFTTGSASFAITMNTDPGATLTINYIAYIAAQ